MENNEIKLRITIKIDNTVYKIKVVLVKLARKS